MRWPDLLRRELRVVLGAKVTWLVLVASALLIGHGFVLALDLFSAASRSALDQSLMQRQMDPLVGVVRPVLGGLHLCTALLVPVVAARGLAVEKERGTYGALALAVGGTTPVVLAKAAAATVGAALMFVPVLALLLVFVALGGHLDAIETGVALGGHALHLLAFTMVSVAAAAGTRTVAQATTLAVGVSLASWAIDAGEGFAALAWIGQLEWASVAEQLDPLDQGVLSLGPIAWMSVLALGALGCAILLGRIEAPRRRVWPALGVLAGSGLGLWVAGHEPHAWDWSEHRRVSLSAAVEDGLREIDAPIRIELYLDRDDGRRRQVEFSVFDRLRLARPDLIVDNPLDADSRVGAQGHGDAYGRVIVHVGDEVRETRSTSRKELVTLIFEAAGRRLPAYGHPSYPGYPCVVEDGPRTLALVLAYFVVPLGLGLCGALFIRIRRRTP